MNSRDWQKMVKRLEESGKTSHSDSDIVNEFHLYTEELAKRANDEEKERKYKLEYDELKIREKLETEALDKLGEAILKDSERPLKKKVIKK